MYLTQSTFFGKTGPINPERTIPVNPDPIEKYYPNRWQEDRNLRSLHTRLNTHTLFDQKIRNEERPENDKVHVSNQKYLAILYDLVKKEHVWKLLKWVNNISEQNKKGLRVIKTVLDIRGEKRFKKTNTFPSSKEEADIDVLSVSNFDSSKAHDIFRKMTQKTSYRTQFGEPPKAAEDYIIMKQKKFRTLDISKYIQEIPARFIEKWVQINDQDEYTKRIYFTIRELHTIVLNQEAPDQTYTSFFKGRRAENPPRFDKMILNAKNIPRASSQSNNRDIKARSMKMHEHLNEILRDRTEMRRDFTSNIDPKQFKQDFLRGQPYDITRYVELKDPKYTSYQEAMHGKTHDDKAKVVDFERLSCGIGGVIPDPCTMQVSAVRKDKFSNHLKSMMRKEFTYTGDSWHV